MAGAAFYAYKQFLYESTKMNPSKFTLLIGLPFIILCILSYGLLKEAKHAPEIIDTSIIEPLQKDTFKIEEIKVPLRDSIMDFAMNLLGTPYVDAACSADGFDCSGFVYYVYTHFKIEVPRSSSGFTNFGKEIPIENARKGDILVFLSPTRNAIGHVGLVTDPKGMETEFIHSSSGSEMKVMISSLKQEGYHRRFVKAVNVLGD